MDFSEAQSVYKDLSKSYFGGRLSMADFHREVRGLQVKDDLERRWRINSHTGKWQMLRDGLWVDANPLEPVSRPQVRRRNIAHGEIIFPLEVALAFALVMGIIITASIIVFSTVGLPLR